MQSDCLLKAQRGAHAAYGPPPAFWTAGSELMLTQASWCTKSKWVHCLQAALVQSPASHKPRLCLSAVALGFDGAGGWVWAGLAV